MSIPCSVTYFLEVGAHVSLKVATKVSLRGKETLEIYSFSFLRQRRSAIKKVEVSLINLEC